LGGWNGIEFDSISTNNDSSILEYCQIQYGKAFGDDYSLIESTLNGGGIYIINTSKILIQNCIIKDNFARFTGGGIFINQNSSAVIRRNLLLKNTVYNSGGGIEIENVAAPFIENNIFIENKAWSVTLPFVGGSAGALGIFTLKLFTNLVPKVINNLMSNNLAVNGTFYHGSPTGIVSGNIIVNNSAGGIINGHPLCNTIYSNNTIFNNYGTGMILRGIPETQIKLTNNIVRNNLLRPFEKGNPNVELALKNETYPPVYNNNIEDIFLEINKNYSFDKPTLFVRPTTTIGIGENGYEADWRLQKGSPEIDAGTLDYGVAGVIDSIDIYGTKRVIGSAIDIGAAEYNPITVIPEPYTSDKIKVYPNPFADHFWLQSEDVTLDADYSIYNIAGQLIFSYPIKGNDTKLIELNNYSSGTYLLRIVEKSGNVLYASKVIKQ
jgi:parallel beta-helix repeat protein